MANDSMMTVTLDAFEARVLRDLYVLLGGSGLVLDRLRERGFKLETEEDSPPPWLSLQEAAYVTKQGDV